MLLQVLGKYMIIRYLDPQGEETWLDPLHRNCHKKGVRTFLGTACRAVMGVSQTGGAPRNLRIPGGIYTCRYTCAYMFEKLPYKIL